MASERWFSGSGKEIEKEGERRGERGGEREFLWCDCAGFSCVVLCCVVMRLWKGKNSFWVVL